MKKGGGTDWLNQNGVKTSQSRNMRAVFYGTRTKQFMNKEVSDQSTQGQNKVIQEQRSVRSKQAQNKVVQEQRSVRLKQAQNKVV